MQLQMLLNENCNFKPSAPECGKLHIDIQNFQGGACPRTPRGLPRCAQLNCREHTLKSLKSNFETWQHCASHWHHKTVVPIRVLKCMTVMLIFDSIPHCHNENALKRSKNYVSTCTCILRTGLESRGPVQFYNTGLPHYNAIFGVHRKNDSKRLCYK